MKTAMKRTKVDVHIGELLKQSLGNKFNERVKALREQGFTVYVSHKRVYLDNTPMRRKRLPFNSKSLGGPFYAEVPKRNATLYDAKEAAERGFTKLYERGGATSVKLTAPDGKVYEGVAYCNPIDRFVKTQGLNKALGQALSYYTRGLDKKTMSKLSEEEIKEIITQKRNSR